MEHTIILVKENNANALGYFLSDKLHEVVFNLCDEYDVNKIKISSVNADYAEGLVNQIISKEIKMYGKSKLEIEVI